MESSAAFTDSLLCVHASHSHSTSFFFVGRKAIFTKQTKQQQ